MPLPDHLMPQTYWEKRCELLEASVMQMMEILAATSLPKYAVHALQDHSREWMKHLDALKLDHPAPPETGKEE